MPESIKERTSAHNPEITPQDVRYLLEAILADLAALRTALNAHTHGGVTVGAGSTGVANVSTAPALNLTA
jgi:hypothetical protein